MKSTSFLAVSSIAALAESSASMGSTKTEDLELSTMVSVESEEWRLTT